jgi:metallo-beta-lactamase family protein
VRVISGFSAHADQHELEAWLAHFGRAGAGEATAKRVFIVHGDPDAAEAFSGRIRSELGMDPHIPRHREIVTLD